MKIKMVQMFAGLVTSLCFSHIGFAGAYIAVSCPQVSIFDLRRGTTTFDLKFANAAGDRVEFDRSEGLGISKQVDDIDSELVVLSFKDSQGNKPKVNVVRSSGETSSSQIQKLTLVNKGIDILSFSRKVDLVLDIGTSSGVTQYRAVDCKMFGGRVEVLETNSWYKAFANQN